jgi:hypothetical protein
LKSRYQGVNRTPAARQMKPKYQFLALFACRITRVDNDMRWFREGS